jgi:drug/metabolite transporter (DMT)-like permease
LRTKSDTCKICFFEIGSRSTKLNGSKLCKTNNWEHSLVSSLRSTRSSLIGTLIGGGFWGLSGTAAQALFQIYNFPVVGLVTLRMLVSGVILLAAVRPALPKKSDHLERLILIAIFGLAGTQLTYLAAIQFSNAPTGTLLQFLFLPMVAGYEAITGTIKWSFRWTATLVLAIAGTVLLIGLFSGNGGIHILITPIGLVAGILAAVTAAGYSLASRPIVQSKGSWWLVAWGFIIGGAATLPFGAYSLASYTLPQSKGMQLSIFLLVSFVIIFGTILAFGLYLRGLQRLSATEIGVTASVEPITASIASYAFLGVRLGPSQYLGGALILVAVILIASRPSTKNSKEIVGPPPS